MKIKKRFVAALLVAFFAGGMLTNSLSAATVQPGSTADPLVSKSYVDDRINQVLNAVSGTNANSSTSNINKDAVVEEVLSRLQTLKMGGDGASYVAINAAKGKKILGHEGTEIILRSGTAVGVCPGENGIVNATTGQEITQGTKIDKNNILIIPRYDGRGIQVTSEEVWLLVKGGYDIK